MKSLRKRVALKIFRIARKKSRKPSRILWGNIKNKSWGHCVSQHRQRRV